MQDMTIEEFIIKSAVMSNHEDVRSFIDGLSKPSRVGRRQTPDSLNDITFGTLIKLQSIRDVHDVMFVPCRELLAMTDKEIMKSNHIEVLGFSVFVAKEVKRINKLFASTSLKPTAEEKQAGADKMNFGAFGLMDYYATRMGITDHEEVERVPWVRIYKCLDIDSKRMAFQRRLQTIYSEK